MDRKRIEPKTHASPWNADGFSTDFISSCRAAGIGVSAKSMLLNPCFEHPCREVVEQRKFATATFHRIARATRTQCGVLHAGVH